MNTDLARHSFVTQSIVELLRSLGNAGTDIYSGLIHRVGPMTAELASQGAKHLHVRLAWSAQFWKGCNEKKNAVRRHLR